MITLIQKWLRERELKGRLKPKYVGDEEVGKNHLHSISRTIGNLSELYLIISLFHSIIDTTLLFLTMHLGASLWWCQCSIVFQLLVLPSWKALSHSTMLNNLEKINSFEAQVPHKLDLSRCVHTMTNQFNIPSSVHCILCLGMLCHPHYEKYFMQLCRSSLFGSFSIGWSLVEMWTLAIMRIWFIAFEVLECIFFKLSRCSHPFHLDGLPYIYTYACKI